MIKVKLKSFEELEKLGFVHFTSNSGGIILTDGKNTFKFFDKNCFKQTFTVADTDKVIDKDAYNSLKNLINEID